MSLPDMPPPTSIKSTHADILGKDSLLNIYVICTMKKTIGIALFLGVALMIVHSGCKDEFNIPETVYIDSLPPTLTVMTPQANQVFSNVTSVPIRIELSDDYELNTINIRIDPSDFNLPSYSLSQDISGLKTTVFETTYTLPTTDSMTYELNVKVTDVVDNTSLPTQFSFTAK
jgi:hypothetical protein